MHEVLYERHRQILLFERAFELFIEAGFAGVALTGTLVLAEERDQ